jgi:hypothetical protein
MKSKTETVRALQTQVHHPAIMAISTDSQALPLKLNDRKVPLLLRIQAPKERLMIRLWLALMDVSVQSKKRTMHQNKTSQSPPRIFLTNYWNSASIY